MLEQVAHWNDLSPKLREWLESTVNELGNSVTFKFNISNENPDPEKYNGPIVWPNQFTLDPVTFRIMDQGEKRDGKSKSKLIGLVEQTDEKGLPTRFTRVRVHESDKGKLTIRLDNEEGRSMAAFLILHPSLKGGDFSDKDKRQVFELVDLNKQAQENRSKRDAKFEALTAAKAMTDQQVQEFASAMVWDETQDILLLRDKIEAQAEDSPELFIDLVNNKKIEYQATIKRAIDKGIISVNPIDGKFVWNSNNQAIAVLGSSDGAKTDVERFAEFIMTGGSKQDEVYKKIKSLLK